MLLEFALCHLLLAAFALRRLLGEHLLSKPRDAYQFPHFRHLASEWAPILPIFRVTSGADQFPATIELL